MDINALRVTNQSDANRKGIKVDNQKYGRITLKISEI